MKRYLVLIICFHLLIGFAVGQQKHVKHSKNTASSTGQEGVASFYGKKFQGKLMANGKKFDENKLTAASNRFRLGTFLKVSNLRNKKSVIVEITDRMHPKNKRLIDVSKSAAQKLGFVSRGLTKVKVEVLQNYSPVGSKVRE